METKQEESTDKILELIDEYFEEPAVNQTARLLYVWYGYKISMLQGRVLPNAMDVLYAREYTLNQNKFYAEHRQALLAFNRVQDLRMQLSEDSDPIHIFTNAITASSFLSYIACVALQPSSSYDFSKALSDITSEIISGLADRSQEK